VAGLKCNLRREGIIRCLIKHQRMTTQGNGGITPVIVHVGPRKSVKIIKHIHEFDVQVTVHPDKIL